jgi:predicted Zn-dependent protease
MRLIPLLAVLALAACQVGPKERIRRAHDALYAKDAKKALAEYRLALDGLEREDTPEVPLLKAQALKGAADIYYLENRDVRQAVSIYKELIAQCPEAKETLDARIALADILAEYYRDPRGAITELTAALARNPPQSAELHYQVAKLYFQVADYRQAELEADALVKHYEASTYVDDAMFLEAQAVAMEDRKPDAERLFKDLVDRFPDSELAPYAQFELGKLYADANQNDAAIEIWVKALAHHPDPTLVQAAIARVRERITHLTPRGVGAQAAFDHLPGQAHARVVSASHHLTSLEAAGGTADEAAHERGSD